MDRNEWIRFGRAMAGFFAVAALWAVTVWLFASRVLYATDIALPVAMAFAAALAWQGLINMCAGLVRRVTRRPVTAWVYVLIAIVFSGVIAFAGDLLVHVGARGAIELSLTAMVAGLASSLLFAVIAGMPWSSRL